MFVLAAPAACACAGGAGRGGSLGTGATDRCAADGRSRGGPADARRRCDPRRRGRGARDRARPGGLRSDTGRQRGRGCVSTVNPDGAARRTRTNARGVDLNRNFPRGWRASARGAADYGGPRPLSEPETRAARRLILRIRPHVTIWFHQPWGQVLAPCSGPAPLQRRYAAVSRLTLRRCRGSDLPGTATRWQTHALPGSTAFVVRAGGRPAADERGHAPRSRRARGAGHHR